MVERWLGKILSETIRRNSGVLALEKVPKIHHASADEHI